MYADFESILEPIQGPANDLQISSTRGVNVHTPSGWCVRSEFAYGKVENLLALYRGKDCVSKFCEHIVAEARHLYQLFPEQPMEPLTKAQSKAYTGMSKCHICLRQFKLKDRKVRDHCNYTGIYRGAAHSLCNLKYKIPSYIPVVFHNLAGYNAHMFIHELAKHGSCMGVIAKNTKDYISFSVKIEVGHYTDKDGMECSIEIDLRFIDSIKIISSSRAQGGGEFFGFEDYNENQQSSLIRK